MDQEDYDSFHDNEWGDIFDLYNACNGVLHNGLLDIRKLDELSAEEKEVLDLLRLREVWRHTESGCAKCEEIITTLNSKRRPPRKPPVEPKPELTQVGTGAYGESGWKP